MIVIEWECGPIWNRYQLKLYPYRTDHSRTLIQITLLRFSFDDYAAFLRRQDTLPTTWFGSTCASGDRPAALAAPKREFGSKFALRPLPPLPPACGAATDGVATDGAATGEIDEDDSTCASGDCPAAAVPGILPLCIPSE